MNEMLKILLSLSLSGSILILILILCKPIYKGKLSKRWQYYIWLFVIARFLLPFTFEFSPVGNFMQQLDDSSFQIDAASNSPSNDFKMPDISFSDDKIVELKNSDSKPLVHKILIQLTQNIWFLWIGVAVVMFIRKITIYQSFVSYLKAGRTEITEIGLLEKFGIILEQSGIQRPILFYTDSLISSPLLVGFFRPYIVLPSANISDSDFQYTILHELTHYKRRDMFYKWLVQIVICLHWFNPLVYWMGHEIGRNCELSCDEAVIQRLDVNEKRSYGDTLLNAISIGGNYKNSLASVTLNESKELLKERLDAIMNYKKKSKFISFAAFTATVLFAVVSTGIGAYATPHINQKSFYTESWADNFDDFWDNWDDWDYSYNNSNETFPKAELINTKQWSSTGITEIEASYVFDKLTLLPSTTENIILKEYLSENNSSYYATTSFNDNSLKIESGERPNNSFSAYSEIYVPTNFQGTIKLNTASGKVEVKNFTAANLIADSKSGMIKITNYNGMLECHSNSGKVIVEDSVIAGALNSNSGMVEVNIKDLAGNIEAHSNSGSIRFSISENTAFTMNASTNSGTISNDFFSTFLNTKKQLSGQWGKQPVHHINLSSNSGKISLSKYSAEQ